MVASRWLQRFGDPLLAALFLAAALAENLTDADLTAAERIGGGTIAVAISIAIAQRRRAPLVLAGLALGSMLLRTVVPVGGEGVAYGVPALLAAYTNAAELEGRPRVVGALITVATAIFLAFDGGGELDSFLFFGLIFTFAWITARSVRLGRQRHDLLEDRARLLELQRDEQARAAVDEERRRIARELHDVVSHAISVVVLQARGGRRLLTEEPEAARAAFDTIERTSTQALDEMRRLLAVLRADGDRPLGPQPTLERIEALAAELSAAGLPVEVHVDGAPAPLAPGVEVSAYRIVQEALTNALKHAGPAHARVRLAYEKDAVVVEVSDDGTAPAVAPGTSGGHGLVGIRERVAIVGGEVVAGPRAGGGFAVTARLPYGSER